MVDGFNSVMGDPRYDEVKKDFDRFEMVQRRYKNLINRS